MLKVQNAYDYQYFKIIRVIKLPSTVIMCIYLYFICQFSWWWFCNFQNIYIYESCHTDNLLYYSKHAVMILSCNTIMSLNDLYIY